MPSVHRLNVLYLEKELFHTFKFLETFGDTYTIHPFASIDQAEKWVTNGGKVDVLLVNDNMGGLDQIEHFRTLLNCSDMPAIFFTQQLNQKAVKEAYQARVMDVLQFPISITEEKIRLHLEFLQRRKAYRAQKETGVARPMSRIIIPFWKRSLDVLVSLTALLLLSPLMLIVSILIRLDSRGPVFYSSKRAGAGYRIFGMYKFRSMRVDADQQLATVAASSNLYGTAPTTMDSEFVCDRCRLSGMPCQNPLFMENRSVCESEFHKTRDQGGKFIKIKDDPRITRLGRFIRNTSIDELPQLFNILRGDMSLVGNRPLPLYEAEKLTTDGYAQRFAGPAGLTGLWQVTKRGKGEPQMSEKERIALDIQYAETFSFGTDVKIMFRTVGALLQKENV